MRPRRDKVRVVCIAQPLRLLARLCCSQCQPWQWRGLGMQPQAALASPAACSVQSMKSLAAGLHWEIGAQAVGSSLFTPSGLEVLRLVDTPSLAAAELVVRQGNMFGDLRVDQDIATLRVLTDTTGNQCRLKINSRDRVPNFASIDSMRLDTAKHYQDDER
ncbi:hypothetical protein BKA56DRAFT_304943 [Ilyonectria sp. MPI-CAGE-AT-0026]|nr:hypothetical protein BKA56DRAFT_304943 [Ilyonectria sp. MPI-CAGE-AT-0026]